MMPASMPVDASDTIAFIKGAYESKAWTILVAAILMVLVRVVTALRPVQAHMKPEMSKWIAIGLAVVGSLATNLLTGSGWLVACVNGVTAGLMSIGAWETVGKGLTAEHPRPPSAPIGHT